MKLTGEMGEFRRDPLGLLERYAHDQGDIAHMRLGLSRVVLFSHPALVEEILVTQNHNFRKNPATRRLDALIGHGLLSSDGEDWKRQRRVTQPAFHRARVGFICWRRSRGHEGCKPRDSSEDSGISVARA